MSKYSWLLWLIVFSGCSLEAEIKSANALKAGLAALEQHRPREAEHYFAQAVAYNPANAEAYRGRAQVSDKFDRDDTAALKFYRRYLEVMKEVGAEKNDFDDNAKIREAEALGFIFEQLLSGAIETPDNAWNDIAAAMQSSDEAELTERLSPTFVYQWAQENKNPVSAAPEYKKWVVNQKPEVAMRQFTGSNAVQLFLRAADGDYLVKLVTLADLPGIWRLDLLTKITAD